MKVLHLESYQYQIITELLSEQNAVGQTVIDKGNGNSILFEYDLREEYCQLRNKIRIENTPNLYVEDDDIEDIVMHLHSWESDLVVATNTPAIRNESFEKLQLVCKTIDYLDSFVENGE